MEIKNNGMNIEEMLASGADPNQLMAEFQKQLLDAQKALQEKKKRKAAEIEEAREYIVDAITDYLEALGMFDNLPDEVIDEIQEVINESITIFGNRMKAAVPFIMKQKKDSADVDIDKVLQNFLKKLS